MADTRVLEARAVRCGGSSPLLGTTLAAAFGDLTRVNFFIPSVMGSNAHSLSHLKLPR